MLQHSVSRKIHLILKGFWYHMIDIGEKTREYRDYTPHYRKRLLTDPKPDTVIFHKGYTKETMAFRIKNISIILGVKPYIEIQLGERVNEQGLSTYLAGKSGVNMP